MCGRKWMNKILLLLILVWLTPAMIAARCRGEASFAIEPCACSVKNRLENGWSEYRVLSAYYARDILPSAAEVQAVADVMSGVTACDPEIYFMYSRQDTIVLGIQDRQAVLVVTDGEREVRFYGRWYRK